MSRCLPTSGISTRRIARSSRRSSGIGFQFARSGEPTANKSTEWPAHTADQDQAQKDFMKARLDVFALVGNLGNIIS
ncbi:hypothetical protein DB31_0226 [Hyalangium minutum]|uniref:Uncharacterized protein n=1 Tax=Hyalangium minutum TaxID=394096 RepID=A0A085WWA2_9BACT|nr:hypothetical protein DB31_0226 [Hyalangium minutum]